MELVSCTLLINTLPIFGRIYPSPRLLLPTLSVLLDYGGIKVSVSNVVLESDELRRRVHAWKVHAKVFFLGPGSPKTRYSREVSLGCPSPLLLFLL